MSCENCEESAYVIDKLAKLLAEIAIIVNGPEPPLTRWSYHDLPEKVRALKQAPPAAALPEWMQFDGRDVLTIHGARYSVAMFGEAGFLSPPGSLLRVEVGPKDVVTLSTVEPAPPAVAVPDCGACPGDGSMCPKVCRHAEENPPAFGRLPESEAEAEALGLSNKENRRG